MNHLIARVHILSVIALGLSGCASTQLTSLQTVAKNWALTVRASQIIPVYPPTEDIQPGDVFLTTTSISNQVSAYEKKGFLPTSQLFIRLHIPESDYKSFYHSSYWTGTYSSVPNSRVTSNKNTSNEEKKGLVINSRHGSNNNHLLNAPKVAFPSYSFIVSREQGLQLALPIRGVSAGLDILGASVAQGTITFSDAYTYGIAENTLNKLLIKWLINHPSALKMLRNMVTQESGRTDVYLRVVSRVYIARSINISLNKTKGISGKGEFGLASIPSLFSFSHNKTQATPVNSYKQSINEYQSLLNKLSDTINNPASTNSYNGSVQFTSISSNSVSMSENFSRPIVIGYHGFDFKIFKSGYSGPISTISNLDNTAIRPIKPAVMWCNSHLALRKSYADWLSNKGHYISLMTWMKHNSINGSPADLSDDCELQAYLLKAAKQFNQFKSHH